MTGLLIGLGVVGGFVSGLYLAAYWMLTWSQDPNEEW